MSHDCATCAQPCGLTDEQFKAFCDQLDQAINTAFIAHLGDPPPLMKAVDGAIALLDAAAIVCLQLEIDEDMMLRRIRQSTARYEVMLARLNQRAEA